MSKIKEMPPQFAADRSDAQGMKHPKLQTCMVGAMHPTVANIHE
jgi:hypothetical protein